MKIFAPVAYIVSLGTHGLKEEQKTSIRINNALCLTTGVLALVFGIFFYQVTGKLQILIPAILEFLGFCLVIWLNKIRQYEAAGICMMSFQAIWATYFGVLLGPKVEVVLALLFMISATYLVFKKRSSIIICFSVTLGGLFVTEYFNYTGIIEPFRFSHGVTFALRWSCIFFILFMNTVCILFYKSVNEDLMNRLSARTAELEHAHQARKIYLQQTSHEIRNPLNAIFGIVQLMRIDVRQGKLHDTLPELVDNLYEASFTVKEIINNVLELSRIEAGQLGELHRKNVQLYPLLQNIAGIYEYLALSKAVRIGLDMHPSAPEVVHTDETRLSQIINNTLMTAIRFSRSDTNILMTCGIRDDLWYISITDQNGGMEKEKMERMFEGYSTQHPLHMESAGLAIKISREFAELLNGSVKVESNDAGHTVFFISFPVTDVVKHGNNAAPRSAPVQRPFAGSLVMVVEDDKMNQTILKNFLQNQGAAVVTAGNGVEALELLHNNTPQLIILDSHMPKMNGRETLYHIMKDEQFKTIPVVIASGDAFTETKDRFIREGASDYIVKPIEFNELKRLLDKYLRKNKTATNPAV